MLCKKLLQIKSQSTKSQSTKSRPNQTNQVEIGMRLTTTSLMAIGLPAVLAACQRAPEQVTSGPPAEQPAVLNTAEVYTPNELEIVAPAFTLPGNSTLIQVAENSTDVIQVRAQDVAGSKLIYRLQDGEDIDRFTIDEETGDLAFKEAPDWENPSDAGKDNNYKVLWQVVSSSGSARSQFMVIKVTDLSEDELSETAPSETESSE